MRFFEQWGGFIWEYDSLWDYIKCLIGRTIGMIIGIVIMLLFFYLIGKYC